jgi:hypothetical protein
MKSKSIILLLCLLMIQDLPAAEQFEKPEEIIVASNRPPIFGMLDGVKFEHRTVDRVNSEYHVYVCHRDRKPGDFKVGQRIEYGDLGPVGDNYPDRVIDRIILSIPAGEGNARSFFEFPVELVRDVTQPSVGPSRAGFSLVRKGSQITVFLPGGDGAYSYVANWHIDLGNNRVRRVAANGEWDEGVSTPWHNLKKIAQPKIINTPKKNG